MKRKLTAVRSLFCFQNLYLVRETHLSPVKVDAIELQPLGVLQELVLCIGRSLASATYGMLMTRCYLLYSYDANSAGKQCFNIHITFSVNRNMVRSEI